jgi:hypothetical protein
MFAIREVEMSKYFARIVYFCASAALTLCAFHYSTVFSAGQPTAVSNLPVVTADRHKVKQKKDKSDAKVGEKQPPSKGAAADEKK